MRECWEGPAPPCHRHPDSAVPLLLAWASQSQGDMGVQGTALTPSPGQEAGATPGSPQGLSQRGPLSRAASPSQSRPDAWCCRRRGEAGAHRLVYCSAGHGAQTGMGELPVLQPPPFPPGPTLWPRVLPPIPPPPGQTLPREDPETTTHPSPAPSPPGTSPSLLSAPPAAPCRRCHVPQHLPHSPPPTSSSHPCPREPPHGPPQPPTPPGPPAQCRTGQLNSNQQPSSLRTRDSA